MAKVKPIEIIASMSGKVCTHGDMYFSVNKQTGKIHTGKLCNPSTADPTAKQLEVRNKFAAKSKMVSAWLSNNKPVEGTRPDGTEQYQTVLAAFKNQHTYGNITAYISKHMSDDGTLSIGSTDTESKSASDSSTSGTSGSGSSSSSGTTTGGSGNSTSGSGTQSGSDSSSTDDTGGMD